MNKSIFIQIASYRDDELPKTIRSCFRKAKFPERLHFGIVNQFDERTEHCVDEHKDNTQFKIINMPWRESRGVGAARNLCNSLYNNEDFTLQIDSHMRFIDGWDEVIIDEWDKCGDEKAVLSCYPQAYEYDKKGQEIYINLPPYMLIVDSFFKSYIPIFESMEIPKDRPKPYKVPFASGGLQFCRGTVCREVPYCKEICFIGEEIVHTLCLFTHGYTIYSPTLPIIYHLYLRNTPGTHRFWEDFKEDEELSRDRVYEQMDELSDKTVKAVLLDGDKSLLGAEATVEDFQNYAGINFKEKIINPKQLEALTPPYATNSAWIDDVAAVKIIPIDITIDTSDFDMKLDYDFWYFGLHNDLDTELIREDIIKDTWEDKTIRINKEYRLRTLPTKYVVWPHSKTQGWLERKEYPYSPSI